MLVRHPLPALFGIALQLIALSNSNKKALIAQGFFV